MSNVPSRNDLWYWPIQDMNVSTMPTPHASASWCKSGPDFLCIGLQKAGTRWLYDLLQFEPGFWMPPFKEFHIFDDPSRFKKKAQKLHRRITNRFEQINKTRQTKYERALDVRDRVFSEHAITYNEDEISIEWYKELFAPKGDLISGDVTPAYSTLDSSTIESLARGLPDLRLILLLRDPISRAWSAINMYLRIETLRGAGKSNAAALSAFYQSASVEKVAELMNRDDVRRRSFPTEIYNNWDQYFDALQIKCLFFDDIVKTPSSVRKDILEFFDLPDTTPSPDRIGLDFNRKSNDPKLEMNDEVRAYLVEAFRDELLQCAETFGGAAEHWPKRYGID